MGLRPVLGRAGRQRLGSWLYASYAQWTPAVEFLNILMCFTCGSIAKWFYVTLGNILKSLVQKIEHTQYLNFSCQSF